NVLASGKLDLSAAQAQGSEVQLLTFDPSTTGGNFTISYAGTSLGAIAFSTTAATTLTNITTVLQAEFGFGNSTVNTVGDAFHYSIVFVGTLANANLRDLTASDITLIGVTPSVAMTKIRDGVGNEVQTITLGGTSGGTLAPLFNGAAPTVTTETQLLTFLPSTTTLAANGTFTLTLGGVTTAAITYAIPANATTTAR